MGHVILAEQYTVQMDGAVDFNTQDSMHLVEESRVSFLSFCNRVI